MSHFIVGTAGHIDHGKTSLVRALTGVDLDRLPEEKDRGITIALGFTHLELPSGRSVSFVDVPGHERLVRTMISGATGLDAALLCVSAAEAVMPQTREHLAILELLGVEHGIVALTMCDLVDEETRELAELDVEEAVQGTFLEGAPVIATSAGAEPFGLDTLMAALDALPEATRSHQGTVRLPINRAFIQQGFGTVVTGTLRSGVLQDGADVEVLPDGLRCRIRGLQVHGQPVKEARAGQRTAVNLAGIERADLARGHVVVQPGALSVARVIDGRYRHLDRAPAIEGATKVRFLVGTSEVMAVLEPLDGDRIEPGTEAWIQLRTDQPLVALPSDRFVVRRESPVETLGGGQVFDPWAPRARRRNRAESAAQLDRLRDGDRLVLLQRAGDDGLSTDRASLLGIEGGVHLGDRLVAPEIARGLENRLLAAVADYHRQHRLKAGAPRRELRGSAVGHLSARAFDALVQRLSNAEKLVLEGPTLRLPAFSVELGSDDKSALDAIAKEVRTNKLEGPKLGELRQGRAQLVQLLLDAGTLVKVADRAVHREVLDKLTRDVRGLLKRQPRLTPADFKALTGLSRKHAIPLLEWLDSQGVTRRDGDARISGSAPPV